MTKREYMKQSGINIKQERLFLDEEADDMFKDVCDQVCNMQMMVDPVNHPAHYKLPGMDAEAIDVIRAVLGDEGFKAYCHGNVIKYVIRADNKGGIEDLKKARVYLDWEIEA